MYPPGIPEAPSKAIPKFSPPFCPAPWAVETGFTPGVSTSSWVKFRPCSGISAMTLSSITFPSSAEDACSSSEWAVTSTTSLTAPSSRLTFRTSVSLTPTTKPETRAVFIPGISIVSV
jgi:hypothetical protein